jgi:hypothetical protein
MAAAHGAKLRFIYVNYRLRKLGALTRRCLSKIAHFGSPVAMLPICSRAHAHVRSWPKTEVLTRLL